MNKDNIANVYGYNDGTDEFGNQLESSQESGDDLMDSKQFLVVSSPPESPRNHSK